MPVSYHRAMGDPTAQKIVDAAVWLLRTHAGVPPMDVLDLVMRGHRGTDPNFDNGQGGDHTMPPAPFARLLRDAFDPDFPAADFDSGMAWSTQATADRWEMLLERFAERYQIWLP